MSILVILMCSVAFAKAALPLMGETYVHILNTENLLNETESRFYDESTPAIIKIGEAIINIHNNTICVDRDIKDEVRYEWEKVNTYLLEPARKNGTNITECNQLYDELHNAQETISTQVRSCTDEIIGSIAEHYKNIEKLTDEVKSNFSGWRAKIHHIPATVNDLESIPIAVTTLGRTLTDAQSGIDNNYLPNLRASINTVEQLKAKHKQCFRPNEHVYNYEMRFLSLWIDSQKCIQRMNETQALKTVRHIETIH